MRRLPLILVSGLLLAAAPSPSIADASQDWETIALLGDGLAEALASSGWLDAALCAANPDRKISVRSLAWGGDSILPARDAAQIPTNRLIVGNANPEPQFLPENLNRLRPFGFEPENVWLDRVGASTVILFAGRNEALDPEFTPELLRESLQRRVASLGARRIVLVTPVLVEPLPDAATPIDSAIHIRQAAEVIRAFGRAASLPVADVLVPSDESSRWPSYNGVHPKADACRDIAIRIAISMGGIPPSDGIPERLREVAAEKNRIWMQRYRPLNSEYIVGRRKRPFGVKDFPPEMEQLEQLVRALDEETHRLAAPVP